MRDILQNIMRQKTRSLLTGFGVFWGMFMMVVLLSVNKGVEQGFVGRSVAQVAQVRHIAVGAPHTFGTSLCKKRAILF